MELAANVFDVRVFRRTDRGVDYLLLKDGLRSTREYITGVEHPARELRLDGGNGS